MQIDAIFSQTIEYFLTMLFLSSGLHKAIYWKEFIGIVESYQLLPASFTKVVAMILTVIELVLAALLVTQQESLWAGIIAMSLLGLYFGVMAFNLHRGHTEIHCGCSFLNRETPLSRWHLLRNTLLIIFSLLLCLPQTQGQATMFDTSQAVVASLCLGLLYLAVDALLANRTYLLKEGH